MGLEVNSEDVEELLEDHKGDYGGNVFRGRGRKGGCSYFFDL
jgi:hypothetical protein